MCNCDLTDFTTDYCKRYLREAAVSLGNFSALFIHVFVLPYHEIYGRSMLREYKLMSRSLLGYIYDEKIRVHVHSIVLYYMNAVVARKVLLILSN